MAPVRLHASSTLTVVRAHDDQMLLLLLLVVYDVVVGVIE